MASRRSAPWLLLLFLALPVRAAHAEPLVFIEPEFTDVWTGYSFWVDVAVNAEIADLTGYDLTIDYDEGVIELLEVVEGALPQTSDDTFFFWTTGPEPESAVVINGAILGGSVDGPGVLARLHFSATVPGVSGLEFLYYELRDIVNSPIEAGSADGQVTVSDPPTIYLTPQTTTVPEGTAFDIDVAINGSLTNLTGYNLEITLDPSVVHYVSASEGPLPGSGGGDTYFDWMLLDDSTLMIDGAVLGGWVDGPGVLAHVSLDAHYQGTTEMAFTSVELRNIDNDPLAAFAHDAVIVVEPGGSSAESTTWTTIKSLFR